MATQIHPGRGFISGPRPAKPPRAVRTAAGRSPQLLTTRGGRCAWDFPREGCAGNREFSPGSGLEDASRGDFAPCANALRKPSLAAVGVAATFSALLSGGGASQAIENPFAILPEDAVPISSSRVYKTRELQLPSFGAPRVENRGIPRMLGEDGADEEIEYTLPLDAAEDNSSRFDAARWGRAAFQWGVILGIVYKVRTDRGKGNAVTKKLGLEGAAGTALVGKRYQITLDVGREPGTWMPPDWGISGRRILAPVAVEFREGGVLAPIAVGAFMPMDFQEGTWSLDGDTLRFNMQISGMTRGDITLPEGKIYFKTLAWASVLSSNKGKLLLLQRRFLIRREWRSIGVFTAVPIEQADAEDGTAEVPRPVTVPPMRIRERRTE